MAKNWKLALPPCANVHWVTCFLYIKQRQRAKIADVVAPWCWSYWGNRFVLKAGFDYHWLICLPSLHVHYSQHSPGLIWFSSTFKIWLICYICLIFLSTNHINSHKNWLCKNLVANWWRSWLGSHLRHGLRQLVASPAPPGAPFWDLTARHGHVSSMMSTIWLWLT